MVSSKRQRLAEITFLCTSIELIKLSSTHLSDSTALSSSKPKAGSLNNPLAMSNIFGFLVDGDGKFHILSQSLSAGQSSTKPNKHLIFKGGNWCSAEPETKRKPYEQVQYLQIKNSMIWTWCSLYWWQAHGCCTTGLPKHSPKTKIKEWIIRHSFHTVSYFSNKKNPHTNSCFHQPIHWNLWK